VHWMADETTYLLEQRTRDRADFVIPT
jgi:hypothetical protein